MNCVNFYNEVSHPDPEYRMDPASHVEYQYDKAGNRTKMIVDGKVTTYDYNAANQMTRAGESGYWYVNTKLDNFFKVFLFVLNWTYVA
jgi:hypothetical protein